MNVSPPASSEVSIPHDETTSLASELARLNRAKRGRRFVFAAIAVILVGGAFFFRAKSKSKAAPKFVTQMVTLGDVVEKIQATGIVQPVLQVNIGAQINGRVAKVYVDYNSIVKKGDVLVEIDSTLYGAQVSQQEAALAGQRAQLLSIRSNADTARANFERIQRLADQSLASGADLTNARGAYESAKASVLAQQSSIAAISAQLSATRTNASYTKIISPVDGVVITRSTDPGSTVQASFQTPTLFVIAQNLDRMRVLADIDEADVGKLAEKMEAEAVVDAFAGEVFRGRIEQLRLSPNSVQGVVTYSAVIEVDNPGARLRPGMTATVTVRTKEVKGTLRVPNAALRYKPSPKLGPDGKPERAVEAEKPEAPPQGKNSGRVFLFSADSFGEEKAEPKYITIGITDGLFTEVRDASIPVSTKIVTDELDQKKKGFF